MSGWVRQFLYHGVEVRWNNGRRELFRYDTEAAARHAARYQFADNWRETKSATYVGRRIHWAGLWRCFSTRAR